MAIARASALIGALSGSIGSITAKNTRAGLVLAKRVTKVNQRTVRQLTTRKNYTFVLRAWRNASPAHRLAWNRLAQTLPHTNRLGVSRPLSGFQVFMRHQLPIIKSTPLIDPNVPSGIASLPVSSIQLTFIESQEYTIHATFQSPPPNQNAWVFFGRSFSTVRPKFFCRYLFVPFAFLHSANTTIDLFPELDSLIGTPQPDEWLYVRIQTWFGGYMHSMPTYAATQLQRD